MRLSKHGKRPLLLHCLTAVIPVECAGKASLFYSYKQTRPLGQYNGKWRISLVYVPKPVVAKCDNSYLPDFLCGRWSFGVVLYEIFTMGRYFMNIVLLSVWNLVVQRVDSIIQWINIDYYMLRAWHRFYSQVFNTISRTSETSSKWAIWF